MDNILYYTIDCAISNGKFSDSNNEIDVITNINLIAIRDNEISKTIITTYDLEENPEINVIKVDNESMLLQQFYNFLENFQPNMLRGYNINGFDNKYILNRININKLKDQMSNIFFMNKVTRSSSGDFEKTIMFYKQSKNIDVYDLIKNYYKLDNYKLSNVIKQFFNEDLINYPIDIQNINHPSNLNKKIKSEYCYNSMTKLEFTQILFDKITFDLISQNKSI